MWRYFWIKAGCTIRSRIIKGAGACIQNMLLAAHALGLGGVWVGEILKNTPQVLDLFQLDQDSYEFMALLVFGHPARKRRKLAARTL